MAERDPRYFKVYQDGDDRELEQKIQQIVESGAAPGIDTVARESIEEIQRKIDSGEIGGGGGGAGVDEQARQEIQEVVTQLADTSQQVNTKAFAKGRNGNKPIITFFGDDGSEEDWTIIKDMFVAQRVPFATAVVTDWVGGTNKATKEQLLELQNRHGWEILSHTKSHADLPTLSDSQLDTELRSSYEWLKNNGFKINNLAYPYGNFDDRVKLAAQKYYRSARSTNENTVNKNPITSYELKTVFMTNSTSVSSITGHPKNTFEHYKWYIDNNFNENGWLIISIHSWEIRQWGYVELLRSIVEYAKTKAEVVTVNEALNRRENIIESALYSVDKAYEEHFVLSPDGKVQSNYARTKKLPRNSVTSDTPLSTFDPFTISVCNISGAGTATFPEKSVGLLTTFYLIPHEARKDYGYSYQEYKLYGKTTKYIRTANNDGTWGNWFNPHAPENDFMINLALDSVNNETQPTSFTTGKISVCRITGANANGFPAYSAAGILYTHKLTTESGYIFQEYHVYNSWDIYKRYHTGSAWSAWKKITIA